MRCPTCHELHIDDTEYSEACKKCYHYIPIKECKESYLYVIRARNASIGVWDSEAMGFKISRFKFKDNYIFTEFHWDIGEVKPDHACWGTAKPFVELCKVDYNVTSSDLNMYDCISNKLPTIQNILGEDIIDYEALSNKKLKQYLNEYAESNKNRIRELLYKHLDPQILDIYKSCEK